ncbi:hypothetical protein LZ554_006648 [Drepanopeziza brunnea f. sp. 'monogermtubi']|nr:hypothetical protein LZ554_006648 [Drepanopeziza brunnea f. sp. 'monogermtubi']
MDITPEELFSRTGEYDFRALQGTVRPFAKLPHILRRMLHNRSAYPINPPAQPLPICSFPMFNKLPSEVRKQVWHFVRGRTLSVYLDQDYCLQTNDLPPVTFRVNHESRATTLRPYLPPHLLAYGPLPRDPTALHKQLFDPNVDRVLLDYESLKIYRAGKEAAEEGTFLGPWTGECFNNIRILEVEPKSWTFTGKRSRFPLQIDVAEDAMEIRREMHIMLLFRCLEELTIRIATPEPHRYHWEEYRTALEAMFAREKVLDPGLYVPCIKIRVKMEVMTS